jgi:hypothetical protein
MNDQMQNTAKGPSEATRESKVMIGLQGAKRQVSEEISGRLQHLAVVLEPYLSSETPASESKEAGRPELGVPVLDLVGELAISIAAQINKLDRLIARLSY